MTTVGALVRTRTGTCTLVECGQTFEQTLACEDPAIWLPRFCSADCERKRIAQQEAFLGRLHEMEEAHILNNRVSGANLSKPLASGDITLANVEEHYGNARKNGGVPPDRYREIATAVRDFVTVPPLLRAKGIAAIAYIYGPEGTGKSFLSEVAAAHVIHTLGRSAIYMPFMDMMSEVRGAFEIDGKTEAIVLAKYYGADLLVIDDITRRLAPTNWEMETLLRVVDERLRMRRPTIFTANYDVPGLFKLWSNADDERVTKLVRLLCDRLADTQSAISLPMAGRSLRRAT